MIRTKILIESLLFYRAQKYIFFFVTQYHVSIIIQGDIACAIFVHAICGKELRAQNLSMHFAWRNCLRNIRPCILREGIACAKFVHAFCGKELRAQYSSMQFAWRLCMRNLAPCNLREGIARAKLSQENPRKVLRAQSWLKFFHSFLCGVCQSLVR